MARKNTCILLALCFLATLLLSGCETAKGAVGGLAVGTAQGAKKDMVVVKKADQWLRKNLW